MKVKCIDNQNVENFLTKEKVYEVIEHDHRENYFTVVDDVSRVAEYAKFHFKVVPSFDDVIKDKEKEKRANAYQKIIDYKNQNEEKRTMNGLEAIELMKQGKMVSSNDHFPRFIDQTNGKMMVLGHDGEIVPSPNFDINYEGYREYIEPKPLTGWERVNEGEEVYFISVYEGVEKETDYCDEIDDDCYEIANYFSTKEKAEEINFKQTLFRKLQRFSDENGGNEIDWKDHFSKKLYIAYQGGELFVDWMSEAKYFGQVYFISREVAQQAIELFHDELIKYFTHDWRVVE